MAGRSVCIGGLSDRPAELAFKTQILQPLVLSHCQSTDFGIRCEARRAAWFAQRWVGDYALFGQRILSGRQAQPRPRLIANHWHIRVKDVARAVWIARAKNRHDLRHQLRIATARHGPVGPALHLFQKVYIPPLPHRIEIHCAPASEAARNVLIFPNRASFRV